MYIPLIIVTFTIISSIFYLSKRIIVLPCNKCSNGSWWYKCKKDTGFGSDSCKNVVEIVHRSSDMFNFMLNIPNKLFNIMKAFLYHTYKAIIKWLYFLKNIMMILLKLNPIYFIYKLLVEPLLKVIYSIFKAIYKGLEKLSFGFKLPVINIDINIGKLITAPFKAIMKLINLLFTSIINVFASFARAVFDEIIQPIIYALTDLLQIVFGVVSNTLKNILYEITDFLDQINIISDILKEITFIQSSQLILQNLTNWIINFILLPFRAVPFIGSIIKHIIMNPYILLYIIITPIIITLSLTFLGQTLSLFNFIKHIIFMLIGCDNNVDFIIIILNILEWLNIIKKK